MISLSDHIRYLSATMEEPEGEVVKKFRSSPQLKPPRRKPSVTNKSNRSDYMKNYMTDYRHDQGKDYQKLPDVVKEKRQEQRERIREKFNLKKFTKT
jgi:hypothetical protein